MDTGSFAGGFIAGSLLQQRRARDAERRAHYQRLRDKEEAAKEQRRRDDQDRRDRIDAKLRQDERDREQRAATWSALGLCNRCGSPEQVEARTHPNGWDLGRTCEACYQRAITPRDFNAEIRALKALSYKLSHGLPLDTPDDDPRVADDDLREGWYYYPAEADEPTAFEPSPDFVPNPSVAPITPPPDEPSGWYYFAQGADQPTKFVPDQPSPNGHVTPPAPQADGPVDATPGGMSSYDLDANGRNWMQRYWLTTGKIAGVLLRACAWTGALIAAAYVIIQTVQRAPIDWSTALGIGLGGIAVGVSVFIGWYVLAFPVFLMKCTYSLFVSPPQL